jgi:hypothetical protein
MIQKSDYMNLDQESSRAGVLCAIVIPFKYKVNILRQLDMIGINEKFIYRGLEGIGKTISSKYHA